MIQMILLMQFK